MIKKINSSTGNFEEQVTDTIVLDTVPTVNSFNAVTSDGVARAVAGASGEVPQVTENDNGKVLTAIYDAGGPAVEWQEAQGETYTAGDGIEISNDEIKAKVASVTALHVGNVPVTAGSIATKDMAMTMTTGAYPVTYDEGVTPDPGNYTAKVVVTDGNSNTAVSVQACTPFFWMGIGTLSVPQNTTFDLTEGWSYSEGFDQSAMDHYNEYAFIVYNGNGDRVGVTELTGDRNDAVQEYSKEVALYSEIPAARSQDGQKFLMANSSGMPSYETVRQVPSYDSAPTATGTMVLGQSDIPNVPTWQHAGVPTPNSTAADDGKVLMVSGNQYGWHSLPASGSDEWWGGDPGPISTDSSRGVMLQFKDLTYDPRNDPDTTFLARFSTIAKIADGIYEFTFVNSGTPASYAFKDKYTGDNEFIVRAMDLQNVANNSYMFYGCTGLRAVYNWGNQSFRINGNCANMFTGCTKLREVHCYYYYNNPTRPNDDLFSNGNDMFSGCTALEVADFAIGYGRRGYSAQNMFYGCTSMVQGPALYSPGSNCSSMFSGCTKLSRFTQRRPVSSVMASYPPLASSDCYASSMFINCISLQSPEDLESFFAKANITNASYLFCGCTSLPEPPRIHFSSSVSTISCEKMFFDCESLKEPPRLGSDYAKVSNANTMFGRCISMQDISNINPGSEGWSWAATDVGDMFNDCRGIRWGLLDAYTALSTPGTATTTAACFRNAGDNVSNPDLAQIPSSWGGTGT